MNKATIIGNLTGNPESRVTQTGKEVCTFTIAVNRRGTDGADFFRVSAWGDLGKNCAQYLEKGKKACVVGPVSARAYTNSKGEAAASLEIMAQDVEFLTPKHGYTPVNDPDDPFIGR